MTISQLTAREQQKAETKERILQAALGAFREGTGKTTLGEVARRAGVAKGSVFFHFSSRPHLLAALAARLYLRSRERVLQAGEPESALDYVRAVLASQQDPDAELLWRISDELAWEAPAVTDPVLADFERELVERLGRDGLSPAAPLAAVLSHALLMMTRRVAISRTGDGEVEVFLEGVRSLIAGPGRQGGGSMCMGPSKS
jgi:AcrR family transcriptional regulator